MHRSFAAWLSARPGRISWFAALFGVLSLFGFLPVVLAAGALPVFGLLHKGPDCGRRAVLTATLVVGGVTLVFGKSPWIALVNVVTLIWLPYALGMLLHRTGSLTLCYQAAVLGAGALLGGIFVVIDDPVGYLQDLMRSVAQAMQEAGMPAAEEALSKIPSLTNWGAYVTLGLLVLLGMLFLGRWWQTLLDEPGAFGREFRQLRLGKALGAMAVLVVAVAVVSSVLGRKFAAVDAWLWIAVAALVCVGLAAAHERVAKGALARGWLIAIYVLLILPIRETMLLVIALLAAWGLADNWRKARA